MMSNLKFILIVMIVAVSLAGILMMDPIKIPKEPELVATRDGCNIYRYYDRGNKIYFNTCGGIE